MRGVVLGLSHQPELPIRDESTARFDRLIQRTVHDLLGEALCGARLDCEVLEVGAGRGALADHLLRTAPQLRMVVTDYDFEQVAKANRLLAPFSGRAVVACADVCNLPFSNDRFDLALAMAVLHHTPDWPLAVGEAIRVLRPGGRLVGYDLVGSSSPHPESVPGGPMRRRRFEDTLSQLPIAACVLKATFGGDALRFVVTKRSRKAG